MRLAWLADVLRAEGLDVHEMPGWRGRGRELSSIQGVVWHHTATSTAWLDGHVAALLRDGRRDLAGPLSQVGLERDGTWVLIADGRANHNGYGEWGNDSLGIEAYNSGVGEPWPSAQVDSYRRGTAAICRHLRLDPMTRVKGHRETDPRRKIDPTGLDMDVERRHVARLITPTPPEEDLTMADIDAILRSIERAKPVAVRLGSSGEHASGRPLRAGEVWIVSGAGMWHVQRPALDALAIEGVVRGLDGRRQPTAVWGAEQVASIPIIP